MVAVTVNCNQCSVPLNVGENTRFVTCLKCSSRLEVKRTATAAYTELLETDVSSLKEELARIDEAVISARPERTGANSETSLRIIIGAVLITSDIYWFLTDPTMQSLYVRIMILAAGVWLVISGIVKLISSAREAMRASRKVKDQLEERRREIESTIKDAAPPKT